MRFDSADERVLRAKYHDWCSARVAERFLRLSPDQIYELAEKANGSPPEAGGAGSASSSGAGAAPAVAAPDAASPGEGRRARADGYWVRVTRVAEAFARELGLPPFEDWRIAYLEAPERFDAELLGLWRDVVGRSGSGAA